MNNLFYHGSVTIVKLNNIIWGINNLASRIGVDIGGTFTDFILYNEKDNSITIDKIPTTPEEPQKAVIEVVKRKLR